MLGTGLRLCIDLALPHGDDQLALSTLIANVLGAFVLGFLVGRVWAVAPSWLRAALGAGLLGSFTTFSAVAGSLVLLVANGEWLLALASVALTLVLGFTAAFAGLRLGSARVPPVDLVDE